MIKAFRLVVAGICSTLQAQPIGGEINKSELEAVTPVDFAAGGMRIISHGDVGQVMVNEGLRFTNLRKDQVDRVDIVGYSPAVVHIKDGHCLKLDLTDKPGRNRDRASEIKCPATYRGVSDQWGDAKGLTYAGMVWSLRAYSSRDLRKLYLFRAGSELNRPDLVIFSAMPIIAVGGLGAPDNSDMNITVAGFSKGRLTFGRIRWIR